MKNSGIIAKNLSMELERIFRKYYGEKYMGASDFLRSSLYEEVMNIFKEQHISQEKLNNFEEKYENLDGKSIDEIIELNNDDEIIKEITMDVEKIACNS